MRNQLAKDLLNADMLSLMKVLFDTHCVTSVTLLLNYILCNYVYEIFKDFTLLQDYRRYLLDNNQNGEELDEMIGLLEHTSELISFFSGHQAIYNVMDPRLQKAKKFLRYLNEWKSNAEKPVDFITEKLWFDLSAMIIGLEQVVRIKTSLFNGSAIKPVFISQDLVENIFCQIRGSNGQNSHPDYSFYKSALTSVQIGQTLLSKRGNSGGNCDALPTCTIPNYHPFKKKKTV